MRNRKSVLQREKLPSTKSSKEAKICEFSSSTKEARRRRKTSYQCEKEERPREREVLLLTHLLVCIRDLHHLLEGLGYGRR
jgi:hypothetical protein